MPATSRCPNQGVTPSPRGHQDLQCQAEERRVDGELPHSTEERRVGGTEERGVHGGSSGSLRRRRGNTAGKVPVGLLCQACFEVGRQLSLTVPSTRLPPDRI